VNGVRYDDAGIDGTSFFDGLGGRRRSSRQG